MLINKSIGSKHTIIKFLFKEGQYYFILSNDQLIIVKSKEQQRLKTGCQYYEQSQILFKGFQHQLDEKDCQFILLPQKVYHQKFNGKKVSLYIIKQQVLNLKQLILKKSNIITSLDIINILYDILYSLQSIHSKGILHGRISNTTVYAYAKHNTQSCSYTLNIIDIHQFYNKYSQTNQINIFKSEGQQCGLQLSQKDDIESLIYLIVYLCSNCVMFKNININSPQNLLKYKSCNFYKQMVNIIPNQLSFLKDFYLYIKNLNLKEIPNYKYWLKKIKKTRMLIISELNLKNTSLQKDQLSEIVNKEDKSLLLNNNNKFWFQTDLVQSQINQQTFIPKKLLNQSKCKFISDIQTKAFL